MAAIIDLTLPSPPALAPSPPPIPRVKKSRIRHLTTQLHTHSTTLSLEQRQLHTVVQQLEAAVPGADFCAYARLVVEAVGKVGRELEGKERVLRELMVELGVRRREEVVVLDEEKVVVLDEEMAVERTREGVVELDLSPLEEQVKERSSIVESRYPQARQRRRQEPVEKPLVGPPQKRRKTEDLPPPPTLPEPTKAPQRHRQLPDSPLPPPLPSSSPKRSSPPVPTTHLGPFIANSPCPTPETESDDDETNPMSLQVRYVQRGKAWPLRLPPKVVAVPPVPKEAVGPKRRRGRRVVEDESE